MVDHRPRELSNKHRNHKSKFDFAVDKDASTYRMQTRVYKRTFLGAPIRNKKGELVDVVAGMGSDHYELPLNNPTGTQLVHPIYDRTTPSLDTDSFHVDSELKMRFRSTITQPQNLDYFVSFDGYDDEYKLGGGRHGRDRYSGKQDGGDDEPGDGQDDGGNGNGRAKKKQMRNNQRKKPNSGNGRKRTIQGGNLS